MTNIIHIVYFVLIPVCLCSNISETNNLKNKVDYLRKKSHSLISNDNENFKNMLMGGGEIKLCDKMEIDISSWSVVTPNVSKIIGNGDNSTLEIYPDIYGSIQLFEKVNNVEISNLNIEIKAYNRSERIYITSGLMNEMNNVKLSGFHIKIVNKIHISLNKNSFGLISNSIHSSILNDVGIEFGDINIELLDGYVDFSFISNEVLNTKILTYKGIYLKGKAITINSVNLYAKLANGLVFASVNNVNFKYVIIDIELINIFFCGFMSLSIFVGSANSDISIDNSILIIRKKLQYKEWGKCNPIFSNSLSGFIISVASYKTLHINHCLIDIHFGEIVVNYYIPDEKKNTKRGFIFNGVIESNEKSLMEINCITVKYHFNTDFVTKKNPACSVGCIIFCYCKAVATPYLISSNNIPLFRISNSFFVITKNINVKSDVKFLYGLYEVSNSYIYDPDNLLDKIDGLTSGNVDTLYPSIKLIGYSKFGSIIYDPVIPYYDYNSNNINYEIFENIKPKYENHCNLYPNFTTEETTNKTRGMASIIITVIIFVIVTIILGVTVVMMIGKYQFKGYRKIQSTN